MDKKSRPGFPGRLGLICSGKPKGAIATLENREAQTG
jgi:hypothetical protein